MINGQNICDQPFESLLNPYTNEQLINIQLADTLAGTTNIIHELCLDDVCVTKTNRVIIAPGSVSQINIEYPYQNSLLGSEMPIVVTAQDQFGNLIGEQLDQYQLRVDTGKINQRQAPQEFTHFGRASFLYESAIDDTPQSVTITVEPVDGQSSSGLPTQTATFNIVQ